MLRMRMPAPRQFVESPVKVYVNLYRIRLLG